MVVAFIPKNRSTVAGCGGHMEPRSQHPKGNLGLWGRFWDCSEPRENISKLNTPVIVSIVYMLNFL